jgi:hypothetical protein
VLLPCPLHVLLPRDPRFLGAGLHLSQLSHFRGPAHNTSTGCNQVTRQRRHAGDRALRGLIPRRGRLKSKEPQSSNSMRCWRNPASGYRPRVEHKPPLYRGVLRQRGRELLLEDGWRPVGRRSSGIRRGGCAGASLLDRPGHKMCIAPCRRQAAIPSGSGRRHDLLAVGDENPPTARY